MTLSIVSRLTNGRAPSCTSTTLTAGGNTRNPARTDWARAAPPGTRLRRSPSSFPSHSGGRSAKPAGTATTTRSTAGWDVKGRSARSSIGTPWIGRNCFGSPGPARTPAPAATITTPTSGGEAAGELIDPVHADDVQPGRAHPRARRQEDTPEPLAGGFSEPSLHAPDRSDLPAQPDLAQEQGIGGKRPVAHAGHERRRHRQIARRLEQPHAPRHIDEHVQLGERQPAAALQDRQQHGEATVVEARGDPLRRAEPRPRRERLALDEHWPRSPHQRRHRGARRAARPAPADGSRRGPHGLEPPRRPRAAALGRATPHPTRRAWESRSARAWPRTAAAGWTSRSQARPPPTPPSPGQFRHPARSRTPGGRFATARTLSLPRRTVGRADYLTARCGFCPTVRPSD